MPALNSSAIDRAEYNHSTKVLELWFVNSNGPYEYYNVPLVLYEGLLASPSKGSYFASYIRDQYSVNK